MSEVSVTQKNMLCTQACSIKNEAEMTLNFGLMGTVVCEDLV